MLSQALHCLPVSSVASIFVALSWLQIFILLAVIPPTELLQLSSSASSKMKCNTSMLLHLILISFCVTVTSHVFLSPAGSGGVTGNFLSPALAQKVMVYSQYLKLHHIFVI